MKLTRLGWAVCVLWFAMIAVSFFSGCANWRNSLRDASRSLNTTVAVYEIDANGDGEVDGVTTYEQIQIWQQESKARGTFVDTNGDGVEDIFYEREEVGDTTTGLLGLLPSGLEEIVLGAIGLLLYFTRRKIGNAAAVVARGTSGFVTDVAKIVLGKKKISIRDE